MTDIRRLVLDVLKPHQPSVIDLASNLEEVSGIEGVNVSLVEIDEEVQNVKVTVEGQKISFDEVREEIEDLSGSIHSVDEIVSGQKMVEKVNTPQDS